MEQEDQRLITASEQDALSVPPPQLGDVETAIAAWLHAKEGRTQSQRTRTTYERILTAFRTVVQASGHDLFADGGFIALLAQGFAAARKVHPRRSPEELGEAQRKPLASTTVNHTLAVLSSFYAYALRHGFWTGSNPIDRVERRPVEAYARAQALDEGRVVDAVGKIGTVRLKDVRDFALFVLAFSTGRRVTEIVSMTIGQLTWQTVKSRGEQRRALTVTFRAKGGKVIVDALEPDVAAALSSYLTRLYGPDWHAQPADAPVWVNCSPNPAVRGQPLRAIGVAYLFKRHLGADAHPHQARHSFSVTMDEVRAPLSEIQRRLGHANIATTSRYLGRLRTEDNPYGADVVRRLGLRRATPTPEGAETS